MSKNGKKHLMFHKKRALHHRRGVKTFRVLTAARDRYRTIHPRRTPPPTNGCADCGTMAGEPCECPSLKV